MIIDILYKRFPLHQCVRLSCTLFVYVVNVITVTCVAVGHVNRLSTVDLAKLVLVGNFVEVVILVYIQSRLMTLVTRSVTVDKLTNNDDGDSPRMTSKLIGNALITMLQFSMISFGGTAIITLSSATTPYGAFALVELLFSIVISLNLGDVFDGDARRSR